MLRPKSASKKRAKSRTSDAASQPRPNTKNSKQQRAKNGVYGKLVLALSFNLIAMVGLGLLIYGYARSGDQKADNLVVLEESLGVKTVAETNDTIKSNRKFAIHYNRDQFNAVGYIVQKNGTEFIQVTGKDLKKTDDYSVVYFNDKQLKKKELVNKLKASRSELTLSTNNNNDFFKRREAEQPGLSKLDQTERHYKPKDSTTAKYTETSRKDLEVNGIKYRYVVYDSINPQVPNSKFLATQTEVYYTVQNDLPYVFQLVKYPYDANGLYVETQQFDDALKALIGNISYGEKAQADVYGSSNNSSGGKVTSTDDSTAANLPKDLEGETALKVAAKNQPAVVRIGHVHCADIALLLPNKQEYMRLDDSCSPVVGSGSIVSNNGYISTNGHVVTQSIALPLLVGLSLKSQAGDSKPINKYLSYLVDAGIMSQAEIEDMVSGVRDGNAEAIAKLTYSAENIPAELMAISNESRDYAIQLGNDPIKYSTKGSKIAFNYSKTVVPAKFIDANFTLAGSSQGKYDVSNSQSSDVAILKMDGDSFPVVKLGSVESIRSGDLITAIGFPAFVDDGLETKLRYTVPSITQGRVREIRFDSPEQIRKIVISNTPIAGGNSGGPSFTEDGLMAGLNTYGLAGCPDDQCFGSISVFRDVADYKALLAKNQISADTNSKLTAQWTGAIDSFIDGNYKAALEGFKDVKESYPAFYLAGSLITQTEAKIAEANKALALKVGIGVMFIVLGVGIFIAWRMYGHVKLHRQQQYYSPQPYGPTYPNNPSASPAPPQAQQPQLAATQPYEQPAFTQPPTQPAAYNQPTYTNPQPVPPVATTLPTNPAAPVTPMPPVQQTQVPVAPAQNPVATPPSLPPQPQTSVNTYGNVVAPTSVEAPNQQPPVQPTNEDEPPRAIVG